MSKWAFLRPIIDGQKQQWHLPYDPLDHNNHIVNKYGPFTNFVTIEHIQALFKPSTLIWG